MPPRIIHPWRSETPTRRHRGPIRPGSWSLALSLHCVCMRAALQCGRRTGTSAAAAAPRASRFHVASTPEAGGGSRTAIARSRTGAGCGVGVEVCNGAKGRVCACGTLRRVLSVTHLLATRDVLLLAEQRLDAHCSAAQLPPVRHGKASGSHRDTPMGRPALHLLMYSAVSLASGHRQELLFLDLESMKPILASEEVWACQVDGHTCKS
jgi:hypothetical protein